MSETLEQRIKRHEGLSLNLYRDHLGNLTIGYGRNLDQGIRKDEAELMFRNDLQYAESAANALLGFEKCDSVRQEVLIEMVFQLGFRSVSGFRKMLAAIERRDFETAADEMIDSRWYEQTPDRCKELAELMRHGCGGCGD